MMIRTFCVILGWMIQVILNFAKLISIMINGDHCSHRTKSIVTDEEL